ncbi:MAG: hypothetical protein DIU79_09965 [Actinobacteria bacterium]|nr:MAG: hypothetical protein DIU79_09965 [Actinomycetota bacterium]
MTAMMERILVPGAIRQFATAMHSAAGTEHHVASPMGAWLLLALIGNAIDGLDRSKVESVLGLSATSAEQLARELLDKPHPALAMATAAWTAPEWRTDALTTWEKGLPRSTERGPIPTQQEADEWTRDRTRGLIDRFPLELDRFTRFVLSTVLATKVTWLEPFEVADARALWPDGTPPVSRVLRAVPRHHMSIVATSLGDVAVHAARSADGLMVVSVAAQPEAPPEAVIDVAYRVTEALVSSPHRLRTRSLFDLPLGESPLWVIKEESVFTPSGREEKYEALLPAWTARTEHDLLKSDRLGFGPAATAFVKKMGHDPSGVTMKSAQAAVASYGREGFSAGAVSAFAVAPIGAPLASQAGLRRTALLRFAGPYAVVAVATDPNWVIGAPIMPSGGWHGLPLFSAWVTEYTEP